MLLSEDPKKALQKYLPYPRVLVPEIPPLATGEGRRHVLLLLAQHLLFLLVITSWFPWESASPQLSLKLLNGVDSYPKFGGGLRQS